VRVMVGFERMKERCVHPSIKRCAGDSVDNDGRLAPREDPWIRCINTDLINILRIDTSFVMDPVIAGITPKTHCKHIGLPFLWQGPSRSYPTTHII